MSQLIDAIATDSQRLRKTMGEGCEVALDGLNSRIEWQRVGPLELLLYLPYSLTAEKCGAGR